MSDPLNYLSNVPGNQTSYWKECPWFLVQYQNNDGSYNVGDGAEYQMFTRVADSVPQVWHSIVAPIESLGDGTFQMHFDGPLVLQFKTRLKDDGTGVEFRLKVNDNVVHTYRTSLVHNGGCVDVLMNHSLVVAQSDIVKINVQAYINVGTATIQDFDDYGNPNTLIYFTAI